MAVKPVLLDLCCKAGGATRGYQQTGFYVVGVDIERQPNYIGDEFYQADMFEFLRTQDLSRYTAIHASPPCQAYSVTAALSNGTHPKLVEPIRELLISIGKPYVIENVVGAPLINPLVLCGTMFGLGVQRHRLFECNPVIWFPPSPCNHDGYATGNRSRRVFGITRTPRLSDGAKYVTVVGNNYLYAEGAVAMGIDWMTKAELSQAIPPAYTRFIGEQLLRWL